jgi:hypothetical protein
MRRTVAQRGRSGNQRMARVVTPLVPGRVMPCDLPCHSQTVDCNREVGPHFCEKCVP